MNDIISRIISNGNEPISSVELSEAFGVHGSVIRKAVNQARMSGCPICSCRKGYYYSNDQDDIDKLVSSLRHRISSMQNAIDGLTRCV